MYRLIPAFLPLVAFGAAGSAVWIHDYHLMLVPSLLRRRLPAATIGFFLHVPFPTSELFRCLHGAPPPEHHP